MQFAEQKVSAVVVLFSSIRLVEGRLTFYQLARVRFSHGVQVVNGFNYSLKTLTIQRKQCKHELTWGTLAASGNLEKFQTPLGVGGKRPSSSCSLPITNRSEHLGASRFVVQYGCYLGRQQALILTRVVESTLHKLSVKPAPLPSGIGPFVYWQDS